MEKQEGMRITVTYNKTVFESDNGYQIILVRGNRQDINYPAQTKKGGMVEFAAKGIFAAPAYENQRLELIGEWVIDKKQKKPAFNVLYLITKLPQTEKEIKSFLLSIKGVGEKRANKIIEATDCDLEHFQDNELALIAKIKGLSVTAAKNIEKAIRDLNVKAELEGLLKGCINGEGVSRIVAKYGPQALDIAKNDAFKMTEDRVLSFSQSDAVYLFLGGSKYDKRRLDCGITSAMKAKRTLLSSTIIPKEECLSKSIEYLKLSEDEVKTAINSLYKERKIISAGDYLYLSDDYLREKTLAQDIALHTVKKPAKKQIEKMMRNFNAYKLEGQEMILSAEQERAVDGFANNFISVITGGPGTGKSTVLRAIIETYRRTYGMDNIYLMAPTGLAAKRMADVCSFPAETIHRQFKLIPCDNDAGFDDSNSVIIKAGLIVIDEFSMVGIDLASYMFHSIEWGTNTRVVIVGDPDQLPSVSVGRVLDGLIASKFVKVTKLTRNFRQEAGSNIINAAIAINNGDTKLKYEGNFNLKEINEPVDTVRIEKIIEGIKTSFLESVKTYGLNQTFVLTPKRAVKADQRTGTVSINSMLSSGYLNPIIRDLINPPAPGKLAYKAGTRVFRMGDRVINLQNSEDLMNGEIGIIVDIVPTGAKSITVKFDDKEVEFTSDKIRYLDLAYCITVHKSQGNEYDSVIYPASMVNNPMLVRNLLYTAVTRAKKQVVLVGEKASIEKSIRTLAATHKRDLLSARIAKEIDNLNN